MGYAADRVKCKKCPQLTGHKTGVCIKCRAIDCSKCKTTIAPNKRRGTLCATCYGDRKLVIAHADQGAIA